MERKQLFFLFKLLKNLCDFSEHRFFLLHGSCLNVYFQVPAAVDVPCPEVLFIPNYYTFGCGTSAADLHKILPENELAFRCTADVYKRQLKYDEILLLLKKDGTVTLKDYREKHQALKAEVEAWTDIRVLPVCRERVETFAEMCKMEEEENFKKQKEAEEHAKQWKASGRCQHCGGAFSMFGKKCKNCGKPKDY